MLAGLESKLEERTAGIQESLAIAKEYKADPELAAVKACLADIKAKRVDPRKSELWAMGVVN